ncbi:hypothetical protein DL96DRAFT_1681744 [Flagelloscypha sp. PMI_526]|nr:hypothetical protein DL96DRAFT_1681744 [Flagelloscypha sp. PMI_526]
MAAESIPALLLPLLQWNHYQDLQYQNALACRKQKTRCEMINKDEKVLGKCHRCLALDLPCSFQSSSLPGPQQPGTGNGSPHGWPPKGDEGVSSLGPSCSSDGYFPKRMWSFISPNDNFDWFSPLASIIQVSNHLFPDQPSELVIPTALPQSLSTILEPEQRDYLLSCFETFYDPWLCFQSIKGELTPILDLIRCSVASRHLEPAVRSRISMFLYQLSESTIASMLLKPPKPTMEVVQALLVWSLWNPMHESAHGGLPDGTLVLSAAISMALRLRLNQASKRLSDQDNNAPEPLSSLVYHAQVWLAICHAESMMSLGSGRIPMARRSRWDREVFRSSRASTFSGARELRQHLIGALYDDAERGTCLEYSPDCTALWHKNINEVLESMDRFHSTISTIIAIVDYERPLFQAINVQLEVCRMHVLYHNNYIVRFALRDLPSAGFAWFKAVRIGSQEVFPTVAKAFHRSCRVSIQNFILADNEYLASYPDPMFAHMTVAAAFFIGIQILIKRSMTVTPPRVSDRLLTKMAEKLAQCAMTPDHPAQKASHLIQSMTTIWAQYRDTTSADEDVEISLLPKQMEDDAHLPSLVSASSSMPLTTFVHSRHLDPPISSDLPNFPSTSGTRNASPYAYPDEMFEPPGIAGLEDLGDLWQGFLDDGTTRWDPTAMTGSEYPSFGTQTFPSSLFEQWLTRPDVQDITSVAIYRPMRNPPFLCAASSKSKSLGRLLQWRMQKYQ